METVKITSPINHADITCIPFFNYHGGNDKTVLIDESENLYSKLKGSGAKEIYFQRITNGPHSVRHERITQQMLNFFDKYLHNDKTSKFLIAKEMADKLDSINTNFVFNVGEFGHSGWKEQIYSNQEYMSWLLSWDKKTN